MITLMMKIFKSSKVGCVVRMVVDSILPRAEFGPNDHRKDTPSVRNILKISKFQLA